MVLSKRHTYGTGGMGAQTNRSRASLLSQLRLNFVLLPNCLTRAHNQKATGRGNVVKNLFVGNLGSEVTHEELRRLFEAYGGVSRSMSSWIVTPGCRAGLHSWR